MRVLDDTTKPIDLKVTAIHNNCIHQTPWYLLEGDRIIYYDTSVPVRVLNAREKREIEIVRNKFNQSVSSSRMGYTTHVSYPTYKRKEVGIKIKTRQDRQNETKENSETAESKDSPIPRADRYIGNNEDTEDISAENEDTEDISADTDIQPLF